MNKKALTLAELMTVFAVIFIIFAVSSLAVSSFVKTTGLKGVARSVASTLNLARGYAISMGKDYYVFFDSSEGTYYIASDSAGTVVEGRKNKLRSGVEYYSIGFTKGDSGTAALFTEGGSLDETDDRSVILAVRNEGAVVSTKEIMVENTTGKVIIDPED